MITRFVFDYLVSLFTPFGSCLILFDIDKSKIYEIISIGFVLDILFAKFITTIFLIVLWFLFKKLNIKNKLLKNVLILVLYFLFLCVIGGVYIDYFVSCLVVMLFYFVYVKHII